MVEVEIKVSVCHAQVDTVVKKLTEQGFSPRGAGHEMDVYFSAPHRDFAQTDEALRLRRVNGMTLLTYKGPKSDPRSSAREEQETVVESGEITQRILEALGFSPAYTVSKTRRSFVREDVTVCVDHVAGLGDFLEVETLMEEDSHRDEAVDRLFAILENLDVGRETLTRKSYLELLISAAAQMPDATQRL